jgi:hypothetical protein
MNTDAIAQRVARRHHEALRRDVLGAVRVEYSNVGDIDAGAVMKLLAPRFGPMLRLTFWHPLIGMPNTVAWDAVAERGELIRGRVVLHAAVVRNVIRSWGVVMVDSVEPATADREIPF